jgi:hypothetical protein
MRIDHRACSKEPFVLHGKKASKGCTVKNARVRAAIGHCLVGRRAALDPVDSTCTLDAP